MNRSLSSARDASSPSVTGCQFRPFHRLTWLNDDTGCPPPLFCPLCRGIFFEYLIIPEICLRRKVQVWQILTVPDPFLSPLPL